MLTGGVDGVCVVLGDQVSASALEDTKNVNSKTNQYLDEEEEDITVSEYSSKLDPETTKNGSKKQTNRCWISGLCFFIVVLLIAVVVPLILRSDNHDVNKFVCPTDTAINATLVFEDAVRAIQSLHDTVDVVPDHLLDYHNHNPILQDGDFDVASYLEVLSHLSFPPNNVLEYFYVFDGMGGYPKLYVRNNNTEYPFLTYQDFLDNNCKEDYPCLEEGMNDNSYLDHFMSDGTVESYIELVTLKILGGQFYLFRQSNYNDYNIICNNNVDDWATSITDGICRCDSDEDEEWCLSTDDIDVVRTMDLTPKVGCNDDRSIQVSVVVYTNWGGFIQKIYNINTRGDPNGGGDDTLLSASVETEILYPFECGIVF